MGRPRKWNAVQLRRCACVLVSIVAVLFAAVLWQRVQPDGAALEARLAALQREASSLRAEYAKFQQQQGSDPYVRIDLSRMLGLQSTFMGISTDW